MNISEKRLEQIFNSLLDADRIHKMSAVLTPLTNAELEAMYEDCLEQYGMQLALGALERSDWVCGTLVINANSASIEFNRTALDAIRSEGERRKAALLATPNGVPN
jgi:hypothetical protein